MEYKTRKVSDVSAEVTITNTAEELEEAFQAIYHQARERLQLPGFRRGKAPPALVEKHLGASAAEDAIRLLLRNNLDDCLKSLSPQPLHLPKFGVESFDRQKGVVFTATYETMPEVNLGSYKGIAIKEKRIAVDEGTVDQRIEAISRSHAALHSREGEPAQQKDQATVALIIFHKGQELYSSKELKIVVGAGNTLPGLDEEIIGMRSGEKKSFELNIAKDFPDKKYAGLLLHIEAEMLLLQYKEYPAIDDEFAKDVGDFETLAELKKKCQEELERVGQQAIQADSRRRILEEVVDRSKFGIPKTLIKKTVEKDISRICQRLGLTGEAAGLEQLAKLLNKPPQELHSEIERRASRSVASDLVLLRLSEELKPQVESAEIQKEIRDQYSSRATPEQMQALLDDSELVSRVENELAAKKILDWLYENAEVQQEGSLPFRELQKKGVVT